MLSYAMGRRGEQKEPRVVTNNNEKREGKNTIKKPP